MVFGTILRRAIKPSMVRSYTKQVQEFVPPESEKGVFDKVHPLTIVPLCVLFQFLHQHWLYSSLSAGAYEYWDKKMSGEEIEEH